jgi:hypothetical protein
MSIPPAQSGGPLPTFRLDVQYTRLASAFEGEGLSAILLKGPAFDQLLFAGARKRGYSDIDVLVEPGSTERAAGLMERLGFQGAEKRALARFGWRAGVVVGLLAPSHATAWVRDRDRFTVDVHHTLPLVRASAEDVWRALAAHRATITVVGSPVETIDRPASALLIALHAAHHGPSWRRAQTDLERACQVLEPDCWYAAAQLAREVKAERAMGVGLGTTLAGGAIARGLGLRTRPTLAHWLIWWVTASIDRRRTATRDRDL